MRRETQNVLLVLLGGALLKIAFNGQYLNYVRPWIQPYLVAAGATTILLAVVGLARDVRATSARAHAAAPEGGAAPDGGAAPEDGAAPEGVSPDGHGHDHSSRSPWLLLLPVLAIFLIAPPALGADKVARTGDSAAVAGQGTSGTASFQALPAGDAPLLTIGDAVTRAVWDSSGTLDGRQIRLVGFVVRMPDGTVDLARLVINCCAADARAVKVRLVGDGANAYQPDTWLEARGEIVADTATEASAWVPDFRITSLREVPAPQDPYES